jgi:hypothetical protein
MIPGSLTVALFSAGAWAGEAPAVRAVVSAEPFVLTSPYAYAWSAEAPEVRGGTLLELDVAPAWLVVRDIDQPVLYVGSTPAEVLRRDLAAERMWVVVPGALPASVAIWFGPATLPERVTAESGARALAAAEAAGLVPLPVPRAAAAVTVADHAALAARVAPGR